MAQRLPFALLVLLIAALAMPACATRGGGRGDDDDDDDDSAANDDDSGADDDDATADDDDATANDDDATANDDDATANDDDATANDDDATANDDDATADDDDATGDDDDATAGPAAPGDILLTEVMTNPGAVDDDFGEWVELYNTTSAAIDLSGWTLSDRDTDTVVLSPTSPLVIAPGGYLVLGRDPATATNGGVVLDWSYGTAITLANGSDEVVLVDDLGTEIVGLDYTDSFPNPSGVSTIYPGTPSYPAIMNEANWCFTPTTGPTYGLGDFGSPGAANGGC